MSRTNAGRVRKLLGAAVALASLAAASPATAQAGALEPLKLYQRTLSETCLNAASCSDTAPAPAANRILRVTNLTCRTATPSAATYRLVTLQSGGALLTPPMTLAGSVSAGSRYYHVLNEQVDFRISDAYQVRVEGSASGYYSIVCTVTGELIAD